MPPRVFTIGHSDRSIDTFTDLLTGPGITNLADIRTMTMSRANPQFNAPALDAALAEGGITYRHLAALGGLRKRSRDVAPDVNGLWHNRSFHNFADYALSQPFRAGLDDLLTWANNAPTVIMCAEAVWWRCHRRIVADYLLAQGHTVNHLMEGGRIVPAELTPGAVILPEATVVYPAPDPEVDVAE